MYDERLIVALDVSDPVAAENMLQSFGSVKPFVKVGMQLYYAAGPDWVRKLKSRGHQVFLDLKLHDIPRTVYLAAQNLGRLNVDLLTVHIAGGVEMLQAAVAGVGSVQTEVTTKIVGITQLTSTDRQILNEQIRRHGGALAPGCGDGWWAAGAGDVGRGRLRQQGRA